MKHTFITFILLSLCIFTYAQKKIAREYIEWSDIWIPGANKTDLPHVLLIGNSITRGYYGKVEAALKEKAYVGRLSNSKSVGDPALIEELAVVLKNTKFDVIHFNNGLHGFDYTEEKYDKSFPKLIKIIRKYAPKAKLIWANTTPVRTGEGMKEFAPITERLNVRNQIALKHINRSERLMEGSNRPPRILCRRRRDTSDRRRVFSFSKSSDQSYKECISTLNLIHSILIWQ